MKRDENILETVERQEVGAGGTLVEMRTIKLSSLRDVRLELAAVYRKMDRGEIPAQDGTRRAYVLRQIADIIEIAELEKRIQRLEERGAAGQVLPSSSIKSVRLTEVDHHVEP